MRRILSSLPLTSAILIGALVVACGDQTGPGGEERPASDLNILRLAAAAPPLEATAVAFYAYQGRQSEGRLFFRAADGSRGEEYLRLTFDNESLITGPSGNVLLPGDSVLITITVVDVTRILFDMQPSGIVFNPLHRPQLEIRYQEADHDFNADGVENENDAEIESRLDLWRQEVLTGPFVRLAAALEVETDRVSGELAGFTRYAIAY